MEYLILGSRRFLWPTLIIMSWWAWRVEQDARFHAAIIILLIASLVTTWWQSRLYISAISLLFITVCGLLTYLRFGDAVGSSAVIAYLILFFVLWLVSLNTFQTYLFSPDKPVIFAYITVSVFICLELFWLLAMLSADPLMRAALLTGIFHVLFAIIALYEWQKIGKWNFRFYLLATAFFVAIFLRLM